MAIEDLVGGKIVTPHGEPFLLVEKSLRELMDQQDHHVADYVEAHTANILMRGLGATFPDFRRIAKSRMLFFDIESYGLGSNMPLISIAMNQFWNGEFSVKCAVARDFSEEKAVIRYFVDSLEKFEAHISFKGKTFDIPRILRRAVLTGAIKRVDYSELDRRLHEKHHDVYDPLKQKLHATDATLQTFERYVLEFRRRGDIRGKDIPKAYRDFIYGNGSKEFEERAEKRMANIISHNMVDSVSTSAVLPYICQ